MLALIIRTIPTHPQASLCHLGMDREPKESVDCCFLLPLPVDSLPVPSRTGGDFAVFFEGGAYVLFPFFWLTLNPVNRGCACHSCVAS